MSKKRHNQAVTPKQALEKIFIKEYKVVCSECHTSTYSMRRVCENVYICEPCFRNMPNKK